MTRDARFRPQSLAAMELFRGLPSDALESAAACARVRRLPKDMCIFNQGDGSVRAHAIIEGGVRIAQSGSDGAQVVIRFIGPGEMFGTVALFTDGRYPADAITLVDTLEASWSENQLLDLIDRHPQIAVSGATLAHECAICHGPTGVSRADSPNLAGQYANAIYKELKDFQTGARVTRSCRRSPCTFPTRT
jgi:cytochrome c553